MLKTLLPALAAALTLGLSAPAPAAQPGALSPIAPPNGCVSDVADGVCLVGQGITRASESAVSPDGKNVYVVGAGDWRDNVTVFKRKVEGEAGAAPTGTLTRLSCLNEDGADGCSDVRGMADAVLEGKNNAVADVQRAVAGGDEFVEVQESASA